MMQKGRTARHSLFYCKLKLVDLFHQGVQKLSFRHLADDLTFFENETLSLAAGDSDVRRRSKNILDAIENGTANAQLCARLDDLTEQEQTLSFQLSSLEKEKPVVFTKEQYLFLLEQFLMEPSERTPEYGRRLVNTFVTSIVVSGRELVINFNVSDETVNKNKKTSQTNLQKESSSGMRLVRVARIELTAS